MSMTRLETLLSSGCDPKTSEGKKLLDGLAINADRRRKPPFFRKNSAFSVSEPAMAAVNAQFAKRTSLRTQFSNPPPKLRLGTIVSHGTGAKRAFWLCLQPICDSERINSRRNFPLLPLGIRGGAGEKFDFIVDVDGQDIQLAVKFKPFLLDVVSFEASSKTESVVASRHNRKFYFKSDAGPYRWIAELKQAHAQRVAQEFSDSIGRVGLDESEWLRLIQPNEPDRLISSSNIRAQSAEVSSRGWPARIPIVSG